MLPLNAALISSRALAFPSPRPPRSLPAALPLPPSLSLRALHHHLPSPLCNSTLSYSWHLGHTWHRRFKPRPGCRLEGPHACSLVTSGARAMTSDAGGMTSDAGGMTSDAGGMTSAGNASATGAHRNGPEPDRLREGEGDAARPSVAVIGAGASGLVAAKCMLEAGLAPWIFDQAPSLGGLWRRYPGAAHGQKGAQVDEAERAQPSLGEAGAQDGNRGHHSLPAPLAGNELPTSTHRTDITSSTDNTIRIDTTSSKDSSTLSAVGAHPSAPGCWGSLRTNLSRFTCSFSDHAWNDACPLFPSPSGVHEYLLSYAHRFLTPDPNCRFRFSTQVVDVSPNGNGESQQWRVEVQGLDCEGAREKLLEAQRKLPSVMMFDHVVVASGLYEAAMAPPVPGLEAFPGCAIHSAEYRAAAPFAGKRVAVVGASFSGVDIAADVARVAADVAHVVTRGFWVLPRYIPPDPSSPAPLLLPLDLALYRRAGRKSPSENPTTARDEASRKEANAHFRRILCGDGGSFRGTFPGGCLQVEQSDHPRVAISDDYRFLVEAGRIQVQKGRLVGVGWGSDSSALVLESEESDKHAESDRGVGSEKGVEGEGRENSGGGEGGGESVGGRVVLPGFDAIILCTGFGPSLPFLSQDLRDIIGYDPSDRLQPLLLHKATFPPPSLPNLAFVGMYRGPYFAAMELQAKWAAAVFSKALAPPSEEAVWKGIEAEKSIRDQTPRAQFPHGDYVGFCNELAAELGVEGPWDEEWCKEHDVVLPSQYACQPGTRAPDSLADSPGSLAASTDGLSHRFGALSVHGAEAHRPSPEAQLESVREASRHGTGVPGAVFRGLVGKWALRRTIESRGEGLPSGSVEGTATFTPRLWQGPGAPAERPPRQSFSQATAASEAVGAPAGAGFGATSAAGSHTASSILSNSTVPGSIVAAAQDATRSGAAACQVSLGERGSEGGGEFKSEPELLYREEGHFIGPRGTRHRIWKEYVYSCRDAESELSVLFAEHSQRTYLFHTLRFLPQPKEEDVQVQGEGTEAFPAMPVRDGWRATGEHLCGEDMYYASYCFSFSGLELAKFCIVYQVVGPHKDYTSTTVFERAF